MTGSGARITTGAGVGIGCGIDRGGGVYTRGIDTASGIGAASPRVIVGSFCGAFDRITTGAGGKLTRGAGTPVGFGVDTTAPCAAAGLGALTPGIGVVTGLGIDTTELPGAPDLIAFPVRTAFVPPAGAPVTLGTLCNAPALTGLPWICKLRVGCTGVPCTACSGGFPIFTTFRGTPTVSPRFTIGFTGGCAPFGGVGFGTTTTGG